VGRTRGEANQAGRARRPGAQSNCENAMLGY
jgi:hypothetical protein